MKTPSLLLVPVVAMVFLASCQNVPKDTFVRGGKMTISAYGVVSSVEGEIIATGKAAIEASLEDARIQASKKGAPISLPPIPRINGLENSK